MKQQKHKTEFDKELVNQISDLRYDVLSEFLEQLSVKIIKDGHKDIEKGRKKLGETLMWIAQHLRKASGQAFAAWVICKPYMEEKEKEERK